MIVYCIWFLQAKNYKSKPKNPLDYFKTAQFHNRMFSHLCAELKICCQTNRKIKQEFQFSNSRVDVVLLDLNASDDSIPMKAHDRVFLCTHAIGETERWAIW